MTALESFRDIGHDRDRGSLDLPGDSEITDKLRRSSQFIHSLHQFPRTLPRLKVFKLHHWFPLQLVDGSWKMGYGRAIFNLRSSIFQRTTGSDDPGQRKLFPKTLTAPRPLPPLSAGGRFLPPRRCPL